MGRQILLLGIGQMGSTVADRIMQRIDKSDDLIKAIAIDTDERTLEDLSYADVIPMVDDATLSDVVNKLGKENVRKWFPSDWEQDNTAFAKNMSMRCGSGLWRMKAYLSFAQYVSDPEKVSYLTEIIKEFLNSCGGKDIELCTVASLVGGTGSALFLPITFYVKKLLKSLGGNVTLSRAFLAMPDIFDGALSDERKIKGYANAYTAMRELHTVNMTAFQDSDNKWNLPIDFKIGDESGVPEVLFDSGKKKYKSPEHAPFNNVILLERVPGVYSAEAHTDIISDVVISVTRHGDENVNFENDRAVYMGATLYKVRYSPDSIVNYIAHRQLFNLLNTEIGVMHGLAEKRAALRDKAVKTNDKHLALREIERYCLSCREFLEEKTGNNPKDVTKIDILGRAYQSSAETDIIKGIDTREFAEDLYDEIMRSVSCQADEKLKDIIDPYRHIKDDEERKKLKEKRLGKKAKKEKLMANAKAALLNLEKLYRHGNENNEDAENSIEKRLLSVEADEPLSVEEKLLKHNGEYIHPTYALLKLCNLFLEIKQRTLYDLEGLDKLGKEDIPEEFLIPKITSSRNTMYAKVGEARFILLGQGKEYNSYKLAMADPVLKRRLKKGIFGGKNAKIDLSKLADDNSLFIRDLSAARDRLISLQLNKRSLDVLERIGSIINGYRAKIRRFVADNARLKTDLEIALGYCGGDMGAVVYVGAAPEEKKNLYLDYDAYARRNPDVMREADKKLGELMANSVTKAAEAETSDAIRIYSEIVSGSEFYKEKIEKNVFRAIMDSLNRKNGESGITLSSIFVGRYRPLRLNAYGDSRLRDVITSTKVMLSLRVEKYIEESEECKCQDSPKALIESFMHSGGERSGCCLFDDDINDLEMVVRRDVSGYPLHFSEFLNESGDDRMGDVAYGDALARSHSYDSKMWDPSLVYQRCGVMTMPFISAKAQEEYQTMVGKALLYAFMHGDIRIADLKDVGEVFYDNFQGSHAPSNINGEPILKGQPDRLAYRVAMDEDLVKRLSHRYDDTVMEARKNISHADELSTRKRAVLNSKEMVSLRDAVLTLIPLFYSGKLLESGGYAKDIAEVASATVIAYCAGAHAHMDEAAGLIYCDLVETYVKVLTSRYEKSKARAIVKWLNSVDCFKVYTPEDGFIDYVL